MVAPSPFTPYLTLSAVVPLPPFSAVVTSTSHKILYFLFPAAEAVVTWVVSKELSVAMPPTPPLPPANVSAFPLPRPVFFPVTEGDKYYYTFPPILSIGGVTT